MEGSTLYRITIHLGGIVVVRTIVPVEKKGITSVVVFSRTSLTFTEPILPCTGGCVVFCVGVTVVISGWGALCRLRSHAIEKV